MDIYLLMEKMTGEHV